MIESVKFNIFSTLKRISKASLEVFDRYWPGKGKKWKYLVELTDVKSIVRPFDLREVIKDDAVAYNPAMNFKRLSFAHEMMVRKFLEQYELILP